MDIETFKALMEQRHKEQEELRKMDYADYVTKQGKGDCVEELIKTRKNTISLKFEACEDDNIPVGISKSGGYPDLPLSISIPTLCGYTKIRHKDGTTEHYAESAMQLVAQINLSEIAEYDRDNKLPKQGMLYFFWSGEIMLDDSSYSSHDFEGKNRDLFKVIYYDGDMSLLKRTKPQCGYYSKYFDKPLDSYRIKPDKCSYMYDESKLEDIFYDENDDEITESLCEDYEIWRIGGNKLLGYVSGSMNVSGPASDNILLFQFDYSVGCLWDLYWYISEQALADRDFEKVNMDWDMD